MKRLNRSALALAFVTLAVTGDGCTGGSPSDPAPDASAANGGPLIKSANIVDDPITRLAPVRVRIIAENARELINYEYRWYIDDVPVSGQTQATLSPMCCSAASG